MVFPFIHLFKELNLNPNYDLHSTADEPLIEAPPEEAAEPPAAPVVEQEGKLGKEWIV